MRELLDPKQGLLRGTYRTDADTKVIGITLKELRNADQLVRAARKREAQLLDFVLSASAENPAHVGSYRNKAVELLESLGIAPREDGLFYTNRDAALRHAEELLP